MTPVPSTPYSLPTTPRKKINIHSIQHSNNTHPHQTYHPSFVCDIIQFMATNKPDTPDTPDTQTLQIQDITRSIKEFGNRNATLDDIKSDVQKETYAVISSQVPRILQTLFNGLDSENEMVALSSAKTLLNKVLPDLKATDLKVDSKATLQGLIVLADAEMEGKLKKVDKQTDTDVIIDAEVDNTAPEINRAKKKLKKI